MTKENAYKLLELPTTCKDEKEINKAFKKLAMKHHPDKGGSEENFKKLLSAKEILLKKPGTGPMSNREYTQAEYDAALKDLLRKMHEDMDRMETAVRGTPRQRKTSRIRTVVCGIYLAKWLLLAALGLSTPILSIISLAVFGLLFLTAPVLADLHDEYLKIKAK